MKNTLFPLGAAALGLLLAVIWIRSGDAPAVRAPERDTGSAQPTVEVASPQGPDRLSVIGRRLEAGSALAERLRAVDSLDPRSALARKFFVELATDYVPSEPLRTQICASFETALRDLDEWRVGALIRVIEQVQDPTLLAMAIRVFSEEWMIGAESTGPSADAWKLSIFAAESFSRAIEATDPAGGAELLSRAMEIGTDSLPLHLLAIECLLWTKSPVLVGGIERFASSHEHHPWALALAELALATPRRSFDPEHLEGLISGAAPAQEFEAKLMKAGFLALSPTQSVALVRARATAADAGASVSVMDVLGAVNSFTTTLGGRQVEPALLDAAVAMVDVAETPNERDFLATVVFAAGVTGEAPAPESVRSRVREYLRRSAPTITSRDISSRSNLMTLVAARADVPELLHLARSALEVSDYGVLISCLNVFEGRADAESYFRSGSHRTELSALLAELLDRKPTLANQLCLRVGLATVAKWEVAGLDGVIRKLHERAKEKEYFSDLAAAASNLLENE